MTTIDTLTIRDETLADIAAREALLDLVMPNRHAKASERLREGRLPAEGLALVAADADGFAGTVRLWHVRAGSVHPALLLGPLAVAPSRQGEGIGARLICTAMARAAARGHGAILLVGDPPYYNRFGFTAERTSGLWMPGPYEKHRLLARELVPGALAGAAGAIAPLGTMLPNGVFSPSAAQAPIAARAA